MSCEHLLCDKNVKFKKTFQELGYNENTKRFEQTTDYMRVITPEEIISSMNTFNCAHFRKTDLPGLYYWLAYFIHENRYECVKATIKIPGFDINKKHKVFKSYTALEFAIEMCVFRPLNVPNRLTIVQLLLEMGAQTNYSISLCGLQIPLLFFPVKHLKHDVVKLLLNHGATISEKSGCQDGYSVLHYLIKFASLNTVIENKVNEKIKMFQLLCSNGANINEKLNSNGYTPLHLLIAEERTNLVKLMSTIFMGFANVNAKTNDQDAVIHCLIKKYVNFIDESTTNETVSNNENAAIENNNENVAMENNNENAAIENNNENAAFENNNEKATIENNNENAAIANNNENAAIKNNNIDENIKEENSYEQNLDNLYKKDLYSALKMLIEYNVNVNAKDKDGKTALHLILHMKTYDPSAFNMICTLVENMTDIHIMDNFGISPLNLFMADLKKYPLKTFCEILNRFARFDNRKTDKIFSSSLHMLLELCFNKLGVEYFIDSLRFLLEEGADVNAKDLNDNTVFHLLVSKFIDNFEINDLARALKILIDHGADVTIKNTKGVTALMILSNEPRFKPDFFLEILQDATANVSVSVPADNNNETIVKEETITADEIEPTRLHQLFYKLFEFNDLTIERKIKMMNLLVISGIDVNAKDNDGDTVLLILLLPQYKILDEDLLLVLKFLMDSGANVNVENNEMLCPLILTITSSYTFETQLAVLKVLIYKGVNIYKSPVLNHVMADMDSDKRISWSTNHNLKQITAFCKIFSFVVDFPDSQGWTPLFVAARNCHFEFVKALVQEGAKVDRICNGRSILQELVSKELYDPQELLDIAKYLIDKGADVNHKDMAENTVLHDIMNKNLSISWLLPSPKYSKICEVILNAGFNLFLDDLKGDTVLNLLADMSNLKGIFVAELDLQHLSPFDLPSPTIFNLRYQYGQWLSVFCKHCVKITCINNLTLSNQVKLNFSNPIFRLYTNDLSKIKLINDFEIACKAEIDLMKQYSICNAKWRSIMDPNVSFYDLFLLPENLLPKMVFFNIKFTFSDLILLEKQFPIYGDMIYLKIKLLQEEFHALCVGG